MKKLFALCALVGVLSLSSCADIQKLDCEKTKEESQTFQSEGISKLDVDVAIGKCSICVAESADISVEVNYTCRATSDENAQNGLDNIEMKSEISDGTLNIKFVDKTTGEELNQDKVDITNEDHIERRCDVKIAVPAVVNAFDIMDNVGDVVVDGVTFGGDSSISANVGNIKCDIGSIGENKLNLVTDVGNVKIGLNEFENAEISAKASVGDVTLNTNGKEYSELSSEDEVTSHRKKVKVDEKCTVDMWAELGSLKINK